MRFLLSAALGATLLAGCSSPASSDPKSRGEQAKVHILCSVFPIYHFTQNIIAGIPDVTVESLFPPEMGCPHGQDLRPSDAKRIATANIFILNGGGLEEFTDDRIKELNPSVKVIDTLKGVELIEAEHHHHEGEDHDHHHHGDGNPHAFSSPKVAARQVRNIGRLLGRADPERADAYSKNAEAYAQKLDALAAEFKERLAKYPNRKIVTMHEIFEYLARDAGFEIAGEIQTGTGSEKSPRKLIEKIRSEKISAVCAEPQYKEDLARVIAEESGVPLVMLDPVASGPADAPLDYYETKMRKNLETLDTLFGGAE